MSDNKEILTLALLHEIIGKLDTLLSRESERFVDEHLGGRVKSRGGVDYGEPISKLFRHVADLISSDTRLEGRLHKLEMWKLEQERK